MIEAEQQKEIADQKLILNAILAVLKQSDPDPARNVDLLLEKAIEDSGSPLAAAALGKNKDTQTKSDRGKSGLHLRVVPKTSDETEPTNTGPVKPK